ncbi:MAG: hypothetical protein QXX87_00300 [Candidatus Jordarchaeales archaeon]
MRYKWLFVALLVAFLTAPLFLSFFSIPVQAQPVKHTFTFLNPDNCGVNFNVTVDTSILIDGLIGSWSIMVTASPITPNVVNLTLMGTVNGSIVSRGFLVPARDAFSSDSVFKRFSPSSYIIYISEPLIVWQDSAGFPVAFSFDLIITIKYSDGGEKSVHLKSGESVVAFIMPNPGKLPPEATKLMAVSYLGSILLPLSVFLLNKLIKRGFNRRVLSS